MISGLTIPKISLGCVFAQLDVSAGQVKMTHGTGDRRIVADIHAMLACPKQSFPTIET